VKIWIAFQQIDYRKKKK